MWSGRDWSVPETELTATHPAGSLAVASADAVTVEVRRGWSRRALCHLGQPVARLRGLSKANAHELELAIRHLVLSPASEAAVAWHTAASQSRSHSISRATTVYRNAPGPSQTA